MESMGEFDNATPVSRQYCTPVSVKVFEEQGTEETAKGLEDLILYMEKHPDIYKEILRKKKQDEMENESIFSFLKTRFLVNIMGQQAVEVDDTECNEKMQELTDNMAKAFDYNQEIKDTPVRFSKRIALKRARQKARQQQQQHQQKENEQKQQKKTENNNGAPSYPPPPPPPPLPTIMTPDVKTKKTKSKPPGKPLDQQNDTKSTPLQEKTNTISSPQVKRKSGEGLKKGSKKSKLESSQSQNASVASFHDELLKFSHHNLRSTGQTRSPGGTPCINSNSKRKLSAPKEVASPLTTFNVQLLEKFRNTRSPLYSIASPSSGFNSPNDSAFTSP